MTETNMVTELWVDRSDLRVSEVAELPRREFEPGEARLEVVKFALTANNVTYGVAGDQIGYWQFFPPGGSSDAPQPEGHSWGVIPVWGVGRVAESQCDELPIGERLYGYFPMASEVIIEPKNVRTRSLVDGVAHRQPLPPVYNNYSRIASEPEWLQSFEDERCLFFPLFITSFFLYDYLLDNMFFGSDQVILASASSKTAFGVAHLLHHDQDISQKVIGLTSPGNVRFVESLGTYDEVLTYEQIETLDSAVPSAYVDMSGSMEVKSRIHNLFSENLRESCSVGATRWEAERTPVELPGAKPTFFFAPSQILKRDAEWGRGEAMLRANEASRQVAEAALGRLSISRRDGAENVQNSLMALLDNDIPPSLGLMLSFQDQS